MDCPSSGAAGLPSFRGLALLLRGRSGLTQRDLAELVDVSERAVQKWEAGLSYPSAAHLQRLIALYVGRNVFTAGHEEREAAELWAAGRPAMPFDRAWFADICAAPVAAPAVPASAAPCLVWAGASGGAMTALAQAPRQDWDAAPDVAAIQGRHDELAALAAWLLADRCRLLAILGLGGIGKTTVAVALARQVAPWFECVCWRSLRNALPAEEWLADVLHTISPSPLALPSGLEARLALALELLRERRCLLVLDNLETVMQAGERTTGYRADYAGYGEVLRQLGESEHQSCLVLTSREEPPELAPLVGERGPGRRLRLGGLGRDAGWTLLQQRGLTGHAASWEALVTRYHGNPLALKMVAQTIGEVFGGEIDAFLAFVTPTSDALFGGIRRLLDEQLARLSEMEQTVTYELAVEREPVQAIVLAAGLEPQAERGAVLEALEALQRRSLLEHSTGGATLTLQPVVLEHTTELLVDACAAEIAAGQPRLLCRHALIKAMAKDYVRQSQERLIARPLLDRLVAACGGAQQAERRLMDLLDGWRDQPAAAQGYGPGNAVNLLRLLRGNLRGLNLSHLAIRQPRLQGVEAQDASLRGSRLAGAVFSEPFNYPTAVALSADGAYLAAGTATATVGLWRVADRTRILAAREHTGLILGLALSADGSLLASGSYDGTVKLWAAQEGRLLVTLYGHSGLVYDTALSRDGQLVASSGEDGAIILWSARNGQPLATLRGHAGGVWGVALSEDGTLVASAGYDGTVRLWDAGNGACLHTLYGHVGGVRDVALSADGAVVAGAGEDGTVRLWHAAGGRPIATLRGHIGGVWGVALSGDGALVASGGQDSTVRIWETASGRQEATLQGHAGGVWDVALSRDGASVASGSYDGTIKLWAALSGQLLVTLQGHATGIRGVALSGDGGLAAGGSEDGTIRLWESGSGAHLRTLHGPRGGWGLALSGDGSLLAGGSFDGTVQLWATGNGARLHVLEGDHGLRDVALSRDGTLVAGCGEDGTVKLWAAASGRVLATLQGHAGGIWSLALSADGSLLASAGYDGTVKLWATGSGVHLRTLQGHVGGVWGVALSDDGRLVASCSYDGSVKLWRSGDGRVLAALQSHPGGMRNVALSGDGMLVAGGGEDGVVRLWSAVSGQLLATLRGHTSGIRGVVLSGDGALLASGSFDGAVKVWATGSGVCLRTLRGDRPYERMDISGLTGITDAQRAALLALGAVQRDG